VFEKKYEKLLKSLKKSITNTFYIAAVLAVSTLVLLFFLLQEVNTINRKLKNYLEEREDFQKRLAEANRALTNYSEKLEDEVKRRTEEALDHLMKIPLTKLPNRLSFIKKLGSFPLHPSHFSTSTISDPTTIVLSSAIKQKRIVPYFQAIAETPSGKIVKYEVLARLIDEQGKVIPPGQFIQLAK
jgi:sensor c-di-GMP phosphodiesterase-like protein